MGKISAATFFAAFGGFVLQAVAVCPAGEVCEESAKSEVLLQKGISQGESATQIMIDDKESTSNGFGWKLGSAGQSCDTVCGAVAQYCHETQLWTVDNSQKIEAAAQESGHTCKGKVGWAYDNGPGICLDPGCCGGKCVGICAFGATAVRTCAGRMGSYSRLCPCGAGPEVTTTTTTTTTTTLPAKPKPSGFERSLFLLSPAVDSMVMLAAIPAASKTANGEPAILIMPKDGDDVTALQDFVGQYRPETTYEIGSPSSGILAGRLGSQVALASSSVSAASQVIARRIWQSSSQIVVAKHGDYQAALIAAPLAAQRSAPLVLLDDEGSLESLCRDLQVQSIVFVGDSGWVHSFGLSQTTLKNAADVFDALGKPQYLVITNPADSGKTLFKGLSAVAPMMAVLRRGAVLPLQVTSKGSLSASNAEAQVKAHVTSKGMPKWLAIVGGPNAVPPHCDKGPIWGSEKCRDAPYGQLDNDVFLDVAVGRIVARDLASASLLASRIANYEYVRDAASEGRFATSGLLKSSMDDIQPALLNVGFDQPQIVGQRDIPGLQKLHVSALLHADHSGSTGLGHSFSYHSKVLFSPSVVSSGGCSTAGFDKLKDPKRSVVLTLLHYGAVAFLGGPRNAIAASGLVHSAFWNRIATGSTIGEAFVEGWNNVAVNNEDQDGSALAKYVMMNVALYGDPAFKLFIPGQSQTEPAKISMLDANRVMAHGPEKWTQFQSDQSLADEWKWPGKLFSYGAPGATPQKHWGGKYDKVYPYLYARLTTSKLIKGFKMITSVPSPLGWTGQGRGASGAPGDEWHVDEHADGNRTLIWRVRLLDYNWETGVITNKFTSQTYQITWDTNETTLPPTTGTTTTETTTLPPSTLAPTTLPPTTQAPTTLPPTTQAPTTLPPTTQPPTPTTQPPSPTTSTTTVGDVIIPVVVNASETDQVDIKVTVTK